MPNDIIKQIQVSGSTYDLDVATKDTTPTESSTNVVTSGGIYTAIEDVREIAEGKTTTYVVGSKADITGTETTTGYTNVTAITGVVIAKLRLGDTILVKDTEAPDYWVSQLNKTGEVVTSVSLNILETAKAPVTDVKINNTSILSNTVANIVTNTAYDATSNKIATMADVATKQDAFITYTLPYNTGQYSIEVVQELTSAPEKVRFKITEGDKNHYCYFQNEWQYRENGRMKIWVSDEVMQSQTFVISYITNTTYVEMTKEKNVRTYGSGLGIIVDNSEQFIAINSAVVATKTDVAGKSTVSVSATGTSTDEVKYITIDGTEKKLAGGSVVTFRDWS